MRRSDHMRQNLKLKNVTLTVSEICESEIQEQLMEEINSVLAAWSRKLVLKANGYFAIVDSETLEDTHKKNTRGSFIFNKQNVRLKINIKPNLIVSYNLHSIADNKVIRDTKSGSRGYVSVKLSQEELLKREEDFNAMIKKEVDEGTRCPECWAMTFTSEGDCVECFMRVMLGITEKTRTMHNVQVLKKLHQEILNKPKYH